MNLLHLFPDDLFREILDTYLHPPSPKQFTLSERWRNTSKWVPCDRLVLFLSNKKTRKRYLELLLSLKGIHYRETRLLYFLYKQKFYPLTVDNLAKMFKQMHLSYRKRNHLGDLCYEVAIEKAIESERCKVCNQKTTRFIGWKGIYLCNGCSGSNWKYTHMITQEQTKILLKNEGKPQSHYRRFNSKHDGSCRSYFRNEIIKYCRSK